MGPVDDALDRLASRTWVDYGGREDDLATVRSELERLREERDTYREWVRRIWVSAEAEAWDERFGPDDWALRIKQTYSERALAAEAEVRRLTEGLRGIESLPFQSEDWHENDVAVRIARDTLAASPDGANTEGGEA